MSKHTPGPWFVQDGYLTIYNLSEGTVGTTCAIAKVLREQPGDDQAEANARLIAAAPELLEACEAAIRYDAVIQTCANDPERMSSACTAEGDDLDGLYNDWIRKARAAIRKATGEE